MHSAAAAPAPFAPGLPAAGSSTSPSPEQTAVSARRYEWKSSLMHDRTHAVLPGERKALCTAVAGEFNRWMPAEAHARRCPRCVGFLNRMRREQGLTERKASIDELFAPVE